MGNFYGHLAPGVFFVFYGIWWTIQIWLTYFRSISKHGGQNSGRFRGVIQDGGGFRFRSELCPPVNIRGRTVNIQAILLVVFTVTGMLIEFRHVYLGGDIGIGRTQHGTMYIFFLSTAIMKLFHEKMKKSIPNIEEIEYIMMALALTVEAILFKFHLHGRDMLDTTVHVLLVNTIYGCIILTLAEMMYRGNPLLALGRSFFMLLQGTWFIQVAFILYSPVFSKSGVYNPEWHHDDHNHIMLTTCIYTWHMGAIFLFSLLCGTLTACAFRKNGGLDDAELTMSEPVSNGYTHLVNQLDDEDLKR